jgi:hypothetical protein
MSKLDLIWLIFIKTIVYIRKDLNQLYIRQNVMKKVI